MEGRNEKLRFREFANLPRDTESDSTGKTLTNARVNVYVPAANRGPDSLLWNLGHTLLSPTMPPVSWLDPTLRGTSQGSEGESLAAR